jgi:hypothetical protein
MAAARWLAIVQRCSHRRCAAIRTDAETGPQVIAMLPAGSSLSD